MRGKPSRAFDFGKDFFASFFLGKKEEKRLFYQRFLSSDFATLSSSINLKCAGKVAKFYEDLRQQLFKNIPGGMQPMFDLSGLPGNSPGLTELQKNITPCHKVQKLEEALVREITYSRFIPYLQLHEFEAILFSNAAEIDKTLQAVQVRSKLKKIAVNPEFLFLT